MNKPIFDAGELAAISRELNVAFERTAEHWRDQSRSDFAAQFIDPLAEEFDRAAKAMAQLSSVMNRLHAECQ